MSKIAVRVKGPRISSLTFRPDLSWGCAYSELCVDLAKQNLGEAITPYERTEPKEDFDETSYVIARVGMDPGVHVCSRDVVVLISVADETGPRLGVIDQPYVGERFIGGPGIASAPFIRPDSNPLSQGRTGHRTGLEGRAATIPAQASNTAMPTQA